MGLHKRQANAIYLGIAAGNITEKAKEGDEGATTREYKDDDGNVKTVHEHQFSDVTGYIDNITFRDGKFGEECNILIKDVDEVYQLTVKTGDRYFQDFGKKIKNADLSQEVTLSPFDFEGDNGKPVRGITITQNGEKILSHYYDVDKKKDINGFPSVTAKERKEFDSDDWKMYFIKVKKFLKKEIQAIKFSDIDTTKHNVVKTSKFIEPAAGTAEDDDDDLPF